MKRRYRKSLNFYGSFTNVSYYSFQTLFSKGLTESKEVDRATAAPDLFLFRGKHTHTLVFVNTTMCSLINDKSWFWLIDLSSSWSGFRVVWPFTFIRFYLHMFGLVYLGPRVCLVHLGSMFGLVLQGGLCSSRGLNNVWFGLAHRSTYRLAWIWRQTLFSLQILSFMIIFVGYVMKREIQSFTLLSAVPQHSGFGAGDGFVSVPGLE